MSMRNKYILIAFGVLCISLFILFDIPYSYSKSLKTRSSIRNIYYAVLITSNDRKLDLRQLLRITGDNRDMPGLLNEFIKNTWSKYSSADLDLIDAWGNPLCAAWRPDISTNASACLLNCVDYKLLIWSSGKNGINEFGYNDDVVFKMPAVMKEVNKLNPLDQKNHL